MKKEIPKAKFKEFKPRSWTAKIWFKLSAGSNLNTEYKFSETNHVWAESQILDVAQILKIQPQSTLLVRKTDPPLESQVWYFGKLSRVRANNLLLLDGNQVKTIHICFIKLILLKGVFAKNKRGYMLIPNKKGVYADPEWTSISIATNFTCICCGRQNLKSRRHLFSLQSYKLLRSTRPKHLVRLLDNNFAPELNYSWKKMAVTLI